MASTENADFFLFCNYIMATLRASFQNCCETRGPDDTVSNSSSWQSPPGGSPQPKSGGKPCLHPLGEDSPGLGTVRAREEKNGKSQRFPPGKRRFNGSVTHQKKKWKLYIKSLDNTKK